MQLAGLPCFNSKYYRMEKRFMHIAIKEGLTIILNKYGRIFVIFCIVVSALGLIFSYVFPNEVIDTYAVNMNEETQYKIPLDKESYIEYYLNSGIKPMIGIQLGISKEGSEFSDGKLVYEVYNSDMQLLGAKELLLKDIYDIQYVYMPFDGMGECNGDLYLKLYYTGSDAASPAILANKTELEDAKTLVSGKEIEGNIMSCYIYSHNTYPLVFDLKIVLVMFIAVFCTLEGGIFKKNKQKVDL